MIPRLVEYSYNEVLLKIPLDSEIKQVVFNLNLNSASSPDSFPNHFFRDNWDLIKRDIVHMVQNFFQNWLNSQRD